MKNKSQKKWFRSKRNNRRRRTGYIPRLEGLESRKLLAAAVLEGGALTLTASDDSDTIEVSTLTPGLIQIDVGQGESIELNDAALANSNLRLSADGSRLEVRTASSELIGEGESLSTVFGPIDPISRITIIGGDGDDVLSAEGVTEDVLIIGGAGNDTITGGDGNDLIDGGEGNDVIIGGLGNDNIVGGDGDDVITGGAGNDILTGADGNDILVGGGGTDEITGGAGIDTNSFAGIGLGVIATVNSAGNGTATYGAVNETFTGIENLTGSDNDDVLTATGAAANVLLGGAGNDILAGGGGTDIIDGGEGIDTNSFAGIGLGVTAAINDDGTGTAVYGAINETFAGIENLTGSDNDDNLTGNALDNVIDGGLGNDTVTGAGGDDILLGGAGNDILSGDTGNDILVGGGGTDEITGGAGIDTNSFAGIGLGVTATVNADGAGTATYGAINETFTGIENLTGSDNDDVLTATGAAANVLLGGAGDDILAGGGGTDIIDGGEGIDTNSFAGIGFGVTATVNADGTGTATYGAVNETFAGIENLTGSDNDDVLTATGAAANVLLGGAGDDILAGGGGTDIIDGGEGIDTNSFAGIGFGVTATVNADGTGTATYGAVNETFAGIENLTGSDNDDVLTATGAAANVLLGGAGDDILAGGGGTDIIDGGEGIDTNSFAGIGFGVTVTVNADGTGTAAYGPVNETFVGIENLTGCLLYTSPSPRD